MMTGVTRGLGTSAWAESSLLGNIGETGDPVAELAALVVTQGRVARESHDAVARAAESSEFAEERAQISAMQERSRDMALEGWSSGLLTATEGALQLGSSVEQGRQADILKGSAKLASGASGASSTLWRRAELLDEVQERSANHAAERGRLASSKARDAMKGDEQLITHGIEFLRNALAIENQTLATAAKRA